MYYVYNYEITVLFFVHGPINYSFWINHFPQLFVQPLPKITADN